MNAAADDVTSLSAAGSESGRRIAFTTTQWSVVLEAQGESPAAQEALEKLCRTYWRPIYGFMRRQGVKPEEAKNLTQGFFALLLERRDLNAVRQEKGRLRSYLLTSVKHGLFRIVSVAVALLISQLASLQATVLTLDNGTIKVGIDTTYGGAITYLSQSGSTTNLINDYDHGRQVQQSYYSGPDNFHPPGTIQDPNWQISWNANQAGDAFGKPSEVLAHSNTNGVIYVKTRPKQWSLQNYPLDCLIEQWTLLDGPAVRVHCRLTNQRTDHTRYPPYGQELPAVYGVGTLCRLFSYTGLAPFTGGALTQQASVFPPQGWRATENWSAFVNSNDFGVGIYQSDAITMVGGYNNLPSNPCTGGPTDGNTAYLSPTHEDVLDYNIVYEYDFNLIVGTLTGIRDWVYTHHGDPRPNYSFRNSRRHWSANYDDAGPPGGFLRQYLNGPDPTLTGPYCAFPASTCPKIYFAARYVMSSPPPDAVAQLFWDTNNSGDFSETRSEVISVVPDGKWRIYSFDVAANAAWSGLISQLRLDPVQSGGPGDYVDIAGISYLNEFPIVTKLNNISTRGFVQTGDNILIGGLIVAGNGPKQVILRALGPTLGQPPFNVPNTLTNPTLALFDGAGNLVASNDDWGNASNKQVIIDNGFAPPNPLESAILTNLTSGNYTGIVRGAGNATGTALMEGYDLDPASESNFANISTRSFVGTGANVMIAGVIVGPDSEKVIIRGLGPTLAQAPFNVPNVLANPFLDLRDANGNQIMVNDNWKDTQLSEIQASGRAPPNDAEAAILTTLSPGNYTAILSGVNNTSGNALVEVYASN